jgi:PAS domain S-box-containing protein
MEDGQKTNNSGILDPRQKYQILVECAPDPIFLVNAATQEIVEINEQGCELLGYNEAELEGSDVLDLHPQKNRGEYRELFSQIQKNEQLQTRELPNGEQVQLLTANGNFVPVELHARVIQMDQSNVTWIFGIAHDISEQVEQEKKLKDQNDRLEKFASVVSHDLRNPLEVANLRINLATRECDSNHLDDVQQALDRMEQIIEDLLALARHKEAGEIESVSLKDLVARCWQNLNTEQATLEVETDITIRANKSQLTTLLENLFRNAIEHNSREVTIIVGTLDSTRISEQNQSGEELDGFYIADDGEGIAQAEQKKVFERGYSSEQDGTGFGLDIVSQVANSHNWQIDVAENNDGGAQFNITGVEIEKV